MRASGSTPSRTCPCTRPPAGLVVCCPILVEHLTNYGREVLLARRMAARGIAVQRFHYRGTGHSTGEESEATLESMVADALAAADHLRARAGLRRVAFMGTRFGALVAARAAGARPGGPLVFWEPVMDADRYVRELVRARLVQELKDGHRSRGIADAWNAEMVEQGAVEILGYPLYRTLYESARGLRLQALLPDPAPAVLLLRMGPGGAGHRESESLRTWIGERGGTARLEVLPEDPVWLFVGPRLLRFSEAPIQITADWLLAEVGRG